MQVPRSITYYAIIVLVVFGLVLPLMQSQVSMNEVDKRPFGVNSQLKSFARVHAEPHKALAKKNLEQSLIKAQKDGTCLYSPTPKIIFYNRIGKAGSSSMLEYIASSSRLLNTKGVGFKVHHSPDTAAERFKGNEEEEYAKSFHMKYGTAERNLIERHIYWVDFRKYGVEPPVYINMMRDPASRYISQYHYWHSLGGLFGKDVRDKGYSLDYCIDHSFTETVYTCPMANYQTAYLCGHAEECTNPVDEATFLRAKSNLISQYAIVGTLELFDEFRILISNIFPEYFVDLEELGETRQPHQKKGNHGEEDSEQVARVRRLNHYDQKLYELTISLMLQRARDCNLLDMFVSKLQELGMAQFLD